jgi:tRNA dimethylallyltransferase
MNNKVIIILGPTASGKTSLSLGLAKKINGEIISADSMQIYKHLNIGTAKPSTHEMAGIKHHMMDFLEPDKSFNVSDYKKMTEKIIIDIQKREKTPIIVGGTGLYINSLIYNLDFDETIADYDYRNELDELANLRGKEYLYNMLVEVDPEAAKKIDPQNTKRVIRAMEVYHISGKKISELWEKSRKKSSKFQYFLFGIDKNREVLYKRINERVDEMFSNGLLDEVKSLLKKGYLKTGTASQAIGYKEVLLHLSGGLSIDDTKELIKRNSRRYAKRQLTWFRKIDNILWLNQEVSENIEIILKTIEEYVENK